MNQALQRRFAKGVQYNSERRPREERGGRLGAPGPLAGKRALRRPGRAWMGGGPGETPAPGSFEGKRRVGLGSARSGWGVVVVGMSVNWQAGRQGGGGGGMKGLLGRVSRSGGYPAS